MRSIPPLITCPRLPRTALRFALKLAHCFAVLAFFAAAPARAQAATIDINGLEVGGSNFPFYDVSMVPWIPGIWGRPMALRPVIGTLHYDPDRVLAELTVMKSRGQKKISLIVWHMQFEEGVGYDDVYAQTIASTSSALTAQHSLNLQTICNYVSQLGFEEVQIRFAPCGGNDPVYWGQGWREAFYQQNWNFLLSVRSVAEAALSGTDVRRVYDLGLELGGIPAGEVLAYNRRLWSDYVSSFGTSDTCGFSINPRWGGVPGLVTAYIENLDLTGIRPESYAFDIYGDEYTALQDIWGQLRAARELSKSILISEAYYNNAETYQNIVDAKNNLGLDIRAIMQWPQEPDSPTFSMPYTKEYRNYNPSSVHGITGVIDTPNAVCTIPSNSNVCSPTISWTTSPATMSDIRLGTGGPLFAQGTSGSQLAPWIFPGLCPFNMTTTSGGDPLDQIAVYGVEMKGKLASSSANNTCHPKGGQNVCALDIYWSVPDGWNESITVKVGEQVFATGGTTGVQEAPWISAGGATFRLYAGTKLLDELFVHLVP